MRIVNANDIEYRKPGTRHREGDIRFKHLLRGEAGSPQNYELLLAHTGAGFPSPPHRHNFDQIRFGLQGTFGDGRGVEVRTGKCGYYPEGTPYSIDSQASEVLLLQFGGASGSGFTHYPQLFQAYAELSGLGEFRDGRFYRHADAGEPEPKVQDGYEALWQHIHGKPIEYPAPRYAKPIIMDPDAYAWHAMGEGVAGKVLGIFTECAIEMGLLKLDAGAAWQLQSRRAPTLLFLLEGDGHVDDAACSVYSCVEITRGEQATLRAATPSVYFHIVLPTFGQHDMDHRSVA